MLALPNSHPGLYDYKPLLQRQVYDIARDIGCESQKIEHCGLLNGKAGLALFFGYLAKLSKDKHFFQVTYGFTSELGDALAYHELPYNMSSGVAGIAFVFQHLKNIGFLDGPDSFDLSEIDEFVGLAIDHDFGTGNWDPLHGMVGLGIYFLERNKENHEKKYLEKIVQCLSLMGVTTDGHTVWITPGDGNYSNDNYNFGTAHGMPGLLSFLAQVYARGIMQNEIEEMICSCLPFLSKYESKQNARSIFPSLINVVDMQEDLPPASRLAWCYGDLCLANMLIHCGTSLCKDDWTSRGVDTALKTVHRSFESAGCMDAPFCHGTAGLVHQYRRLFRLTRKRNFKHAAEYWLRQTLNKFYEPGNGIGGYFSRSFDEKRKLFDYTPKCGLLEGSAGIALTWLSYLYEISPDWDIVFLTNV